MPRRSRSDFLSIADAAIGPGAPEIFVRAKQPLDECLLNLLTSRNGLDEAEAAKRLQRDGPNEIRPRYLFIIPTGMIAAGFWLPLIVVAVLLLFWSGRVALAFLLIAIVALGFGLGLLLGNHSFKPRTVESSATKNMVRVRRQRSSSPTAPCDAAQAAAISTVFEVPCRELVVGDVIELSAPAMTGDWIADAIIPADIRILSATHLIVDQSAVIAGSPSRVIKHAETPSETALTLLELSNIGFMDSRICNGSVIAVVIATGSRSCRAWLGN